MLQPLIRRTWAPKGQTPVMYCWDRHDRLSVIAGLTVAHRRRRIGLYFAVHEKNISAEQVQDFMRGVQRQLRRSLIVIMDRAPIHRKAARVLQADGRFDVEWLPSYAPDLNPVEHVWNHSKYGDLANFIPDDVGELEFAIECSLQETRACPALMRSCFHAAKLEW